MQRHDATPPAPRSAARRKITARQRQVLDFIEQQMRERGYPPSVREIGEAIGLTSPSTVHSHLNTLQRLGYLRRDPTKPRAIEVRWDPNSGAVMERRPVRHVPLVGDVAAGTDVLAEENVEELLPVPADFTGEGELFMLRVRGDSMIEAGILDGDFVIAVQQPTANNGDIVVAGIPGGEATVKTFSQARRQDHADPGQLDDGADGVRRRRGRDLRPGRHRHAPPLTSSRPLRAASAAAAAGHGRAAARRSDGRPAPRRRQPYGGGGRRVGVRRGDRRRQAARSLATAAPAGDRRRPAAARPTGQQEGEDGQRRRRRAARATAPTRIAATPLAGSRPTRIIDLGSLGARRVST